MLLSAFPKDTTRKHCITPLCQLALMDHPKIWKFRFMEMYIEILNYQVAEILPDKNKSCYFSYLEKQMNI